MKKRHILIIAAMSLSFAATAQRTPDHNFDFETIHTDTGDVRLSWDNFHQFLIVGRQELLLRVCRR